MEDTFYNGNLYHNYGGCYRLLIIIDRNQYIDIHFDPYNFNVVSYPQSARSIDSWFTRLLTLECDDRFKSIKLL